ncbi:Crp/Fnr family transcriptional regulator [Listeria booriae]|uniref:Crp/Fnr family transcriptional regulator n=1 Tax=Listeria booriae TaxID=1552123 RepID=A0A7X0Z8B0_9LIST|nr:Crp/Fnr family transcriptional regulator [Listeria booriae]MBC2177756.1 Crp/Fnr family transcriptional regulator [Listeria booriae]MBC2177823.1 Crp/Fnr family transcriptional regulator [Listeria booriae]
MLFKELYDKDEVDGKFGNPQLLHVLQDNDGYPIVRKKITLRPKEILLPEDTVHEYVYLVESGILGAWKGAHLVHFIGKRTFIGMDNILGNEVSYLTVTALETSVVWRFSKTDVLWKVMHMQEGLFFLYTDLKGMNEHWMHRCALQFTDAKEQIVSNILELGRTYGKETMNQIILPKVFTKKIISNYLNLTSTTVYYVCKQLIKEGLLEPVSYQLIVNKDKLTTR